MGKRKTFVAKCVDKSVVEAWESIRGKMCGQKREKKSHTRRCGKNVKKKVIEEGVGRVGLIVCRKSLKLMFHLEVGR